MLLNGETVALSLERFSMHKGTLIAEASDLGMRVPQLHQIYDDACDAGIFIRSHKTGKVEAFYESGVDRDREGDVAGWRFKPCNRKLTTVTEVLIIND